MENKTLEQAITSPEARELAEIAQFIGKVKIDGPEHKIEIPPRAKILKRKSGEVKFFTAQLSPNNNYFVIPKGAKQVQYTSYRKHIYHIEYGEHTFHY